MTDEEYIKELEDIIEEITGNSIELFWDDRLIKYKNIKRKMNNGKSRRSKKDPSEPIQERTELPGQAKRNTNDN